MMHGSRHLSDEALLLVIDDELSSRRVLHARTHLADCGMCRARLARIERGATHYDPADAERPLPPSAAARVRLASRLADDETGPARLSSLFTWPVSRMPDRRWFSAAAVLLLAVVGGLMTRSPEPPRLQADGVFLLPRAELTPGASTPVALDEICGPTRYGRTQPIPASVHHAVFSGYGADYRRASEYELDYLITPELGGIGEPRNLWPQPFARTPWNAYVKDELERLLHGLVCDGTLDLATAQREIASDWIASYKRYFHTTVPLRDYEAEPLAAGDRDLILSELDELGVAAPLLEGSDGPVLMALLQSARAR